MAILSKFLIKRPDRYIGAITDKKRRPHSKHYKGVLNRRFKGCLKALFN
jgi:hypothetical protein